MSLAEPDGSLRKSKFTFKQLHQLQTYSTTTPLRIVAHLDLDAFYAQCESVRLGLSQDQPLAVRQWDGLIAVNYAARPYGVNRFTALAEAKQKCPELICQHVATWREGEESWAYHEDAAENIATQKACLDPYRAESRKIIKLIKETLPAGELQRVEKAGIDEVFVDLSAHIRSVLMERYPDLALPPPYNDPTEALPLPPTTVLEWGEDNLFELNEDESEESSPDWDDVALLIGSEIMRNVRSTIFEKLKYTTSTGISPNKMISKLASAFKKPNGQTVVRSRAVKSFLSGFDFTKIRNLGGKLGENVEKQFQTSTVQGLLEFSLDDLRRKLGDESASWLYNTIRGIDRSEVSQRTQIKSMLSAKSFRPSINSMEQARRWLVIFVGDIFARLVEEGVLENKRRPRTMHLHHRRKGITKSKSGPIPQGMTISKESLLLVSEQLMGQIIADGSPWPCNNLMLSVSAFQEGTSSIQGIGSFLMSAEETKALSSLKRDGELPNSDDEVTAGKKRRTDSSNTTSLQRFLNQSNASDEAMQHARSYPDDSLDAADSIPQERQSTLDSYFCTSCQKTLPLSEKMQHDDWHFAKSLADEERPVLPAKPAATLASRSKQLPKNRSEPLSKGQTKLHFTKKPSSS